MGEYEFTYPSRVDSRGEHVSYELHNTASGPHKRDTAESKDERLYFKVDAFGETFVLNVTLNTEFISNRLVVEYIGENGRSRVQQPGTADCHHIGHLGDGSEGEQGWVAISNCRGLVRIINFIVKSECF